MASKNAGLAPNQLEQIRIARWKGRTNLRWLCNEVLGYRGVTEHIHGPVINNHLQRFTVPKNHRELDDVSTNKIVYTPENSLYSLLGHRQELIIDSRSFFKTTVNTIAHTIQFILNYPFVQIGILQAAEPKAIDILKEVKYHFQYNGVFRDIYPDYCPTRAVHDWGTQKDFSVENRNRIVEALRLPAPRQGNVMVGSIEKGMAGYHFDVTKYSDIVDEKNTETKEQMAKIIDAFAKSKNLRLRPDSWIYLEGTRYDFGDLYGKLIEDWLTQKPEQRSWNMFIRGAYVRDTATPRYTPDELSLPFKRDPAGQFIATWPEMWPVALLEPERLENETVFACQKLNDPVAVSAENKPFPITGSYPPMMPAENFNRIAIAYHITAVDTAETQSERSDFSVITTAAIANDGRTYVRDIRRGKWLPDELIRQVFDVNAKFKPQRIIMEDIAFTRGLKSGFDREIQLKNVYLPFEWVKRDNQTSKIERIKNTLQPWYKNHDIRFLDDLPVMHEVKKELSQFPKGMHDDILDTLADLFQGRDWVGREKARAPIEGYEEATVQQAWAKLQTRAFMQLTGELPEDIPHWGNPGGSRTGGL